MSQHGQLRAAVRVKADDFGLFYRLEAIEPEGLDRVLIYVPHDPVMQ